MVEPVQTLWMPEGHEGINSIAQVTNSTVLTEWAVLFTFWTIWSRCWSSLPTFSPVGFCLKGGGKTRGWWVRPPGPPSLLATRKAPAVCTHLHSLFLQAPAKKIATSFLRWYKTQLGRMHQCACMRVCSWNRKGHRSLLVWLYIFICFIVEHNAYIKTLACLN